MKTLVGTIIKLNVLVYFLWLFLPPTFMMTHFVVSPHLVASGHPWTLLTSVFSHILFFHLLINMYVLYGFGLYMEQQLGRARFLNFYLMAGLAGSLGHCLSSLFLLHDPTLPALGASGAISGVVVLFALINPRHLVLLFGLIPIPSIVAALMIVGLDLSGLLAQSRGSALPIGFGAHLGGAFAATMYFLFYYRPRLKAVG
jgi:membrane associated rhomboid family serine protease